jgi:hypothetical protein
VPAVRAPGAVREGGCWPSTAQEHLLRAALLAGPAAIEAWDRWRAAVDFERIDAGSFRLLPLLYTNLKTAGVEGPEMTRLRGVYRQSWYRNQLLLRHLAPVLEALEGKGVPTLVLKGAALIAAYYHNTGARPMNDIDVAVPTGDLRCAVEVLRLLGWIPRRPVEEWSPSLARGWHFDDEEGRELDLHAHVLDASPAPALDRLFWDAAEVASVAGETTRILAPTHQLMHAITHGLVWNRVHSLRWVADALMIVREAGGRIDWDRLLRDARYSHHTWAVRLGLEYLVRLLDAPLPQEALRSFRTARIGPLERAEQWVRASGANSRLGGLPVLWFLYRRARMGEDQQARVGSFGRYLMQLWRVDGSAAFVAILAKKAARRLTAVCRARWNAQTGAPFVSSKPRTPYRD